MKKLRDPKKGCPWDLKQSHTSLMPYFHEELHEFEEALQEKGIHSNDTLEELGDLLFQIVFHAQLLEEQKLSSLDTLAFNCAQKLIHRHPHVFEKNAPTLSADDVKKNWEQQKNKDLPQGKSQSPITDHVAKVPKNLSPLLRSQRIGDRASSFGFDWPNDESILLKVEEEFLEFKAAEDTSSKQEELGDLLFTLCQYARKKNWNIDAILKRSNQKFLSRFRSMEKSLCEKKQKMAQLKAEDWEKEWQKAKSKQK